MRSANCSTCAPALTPSSTRSPTRMRSSRSARRPRHPRRRRRLPREDCRARSPSTRRATSLFAAKVNANFPGQSRAQRAADDSGRHRAVRRDRRTRARAARLHRDHERPHRSGDRGRGEVSRARRREHRHRVRMRRAGAESAPRARLRAAASTRVCAFDVDRDRARVARERHVRASSRSTSSRCETLGDRRRAAQRHLGDVHAGASLVLGATHVAPGAFVAAVGADNPDKQEIEPELLAASAVVADMLDQCARSATCTTRSRLA